MSNISFLSFDLCYLKHNALKPNLKQLPFDAASEEIFDKLAVLCSVVGLLGPLS